MIQWISFGFFTLAGLAHLWFFILESILFQREGGNRLFSVSEANYPTVKVWAMNQGFYNLFLALGIFSGLILLMQKQITAGTVLIVFCAISMVGAGIVLSISAPTLGKAALIQALPPLAGLLFLYFHH